MRLILLTLLLSGCGTTSSVAFLPDGDPVQFATHVDPFAPSTKATKFYADIDGDGLTEAVTHISTGPSSVSQLAFPLAYLGAGIAVGQGLGDSGSNTTNVNSSGSDSRSGSVSKAAAEARNIAVQNNNPPMMGGGPD